MDQANDVLGAAISIFAHANKDLPRVLVYLAHERYMVTAFGYVSLVNTYLSGGQYTWDSVIDLGGTYGIGPNNSWLISETGSFERSVQVRRYV
jgi:hypothetical protein